MKSFMIKPPKYQKCWLLNPTKEKGNDQNDERVEEEAEFHEQFLVIDGLCLLIRVRKSIEMVCEAQNGDDQIANQEVFDHLVTSLMLIRMIFLELMTV